MWEVRCALEYYDLVRAVTVSFLVIYIVLYIMKNTIIIYSDWLQSNNWYGLNVKWKKNIGIARASFLKSTLPLDSWDVSSLKKIKWQNKCIMVTMNDKQAQKKFLYNSSKDFLVSLLQNLV